MKPITKVKKKEFFAKAFTQRTYLKALFGEYSEVAGGPTFKQTYLPFM